MKNLIVFSAMLCMSLLLSGCSKSVKDLTLAESNLPENQQIVLEQITPEERNALMDYVYSRAMKGGVDYNVTIGEALKEQEKKEKEKSMLDLIQ